jgi:hypothetical protein
MAERNAASVLPDPVGAAISAFTVLGRDGPGAALSLRSVRENGCETSPATAG